MIKTNINRTKAVIIGAILIVLQMGFYYVIWMNPFINGISLEFANHPSIKPYEYFGGLDNWMQLRTVYLIIMLAIFIIIYLILYRCLPGSGWIKGLWFGILLSIVKVIPGAFDTWTLIIYPNELIVVQLINGILGYLFFGVMVALSFHYFNVIKIIEKTDST